MDHNKLIFPVILLAGVTACSNDNDSNAETEPTSYSVTAIDGYLRSADVWLDMNGNFILDGNEPKAMTGEHGVAVLDTTGIDNPEQYPVVVEAKEAITVDEDDIDPATGLGGEATHSYAMSAPAGEINITPLSTQVHLAMVQTGMEKEEAIQLVSDSLGLEAEGLLTDFIAPETANDANAYAASNIVDSQSLPASADELQAVAEPGSEEAQDYAHTTKAVNETIKEEVEETEAAGGDFNEADDVFDPSVDAELDSDLDGVPDHIDAFPNDPGRYLPSDKLAYTTWYMGTQLVSSKDNIGNVYTNEAKHFTGTTAGKPMWFYTPMNIENAEFRLSALGDFQYNVTSFTGNVFTNIYLKPYDEGDEDDTDDKAAFDRITCVASTSTAALLRDTNWNQDDPRNDTYVLSVNKGETLNSTFKAINASNPSCDPISKADFLVLNYIDPSRAEDGDPEVTNGNFVLKLGDSNYVGTEPFTIDAYEMAKTYQVGNGPKIVVANAVDVQATDSALTGHSYGKRVWMYPADIGGESVAPYAVIAPLSDYQDFSFATDDEHAFVSVYVVAKDGVVFDESQEIPQVFESVDWAQKYQPEGKMVYKLSIIGSAGSLKNSLVAAGKNIDELELINYLDGQNDGDLGVVSNFILKIGDSEEIYTDAFSVSEFTFSAPAGN